MATINLVPYKPVAGVASDATAIDNAFDTLQALANGGIDNNNVAAGAGIALSKLTVPIVRVTRTAVMAITTGTLTAVAFDSENFDANSLHDTVTNNSRLTCGTAGKYWVHGKVRFDANATGYREAWLKLNNTTFQAHSGSILPAAFNGNFATCEVWSTISLNVGDYVELFVQQTSGGNLNLLQASNYEPIFEMAQVA